MAVHLLLAGNRHALSHSTSFLEVPRNFFTHPLFRAWTFIASVYVPIYAQSTYFLFTPGLAQLVYINMKRTIVSSGTRRREIRHSILQEKERRTLVGLRLRGCGAGSMKSGSLGRDSNLQELWIPGLESTYWITRIRKRSVSHK